MGGETPSPGARLAAQPGPSPRGRGNPRDRARAGLRRRTIPAWAGKPKAAGRDRGRDRDHPRVGGETRRVSFSGNPWKGPSPRGRGNRPGDAVPLCGGGTIPAWAGKPVTFMRRGRKRRDHPRVGGETSRSRRWVAAIRGPSPRGRGNPTSTVRSTTNDRTIPAWAGKPSIQRVVNSTFGDHPRVGGETVGRLWTVNASKGPSPRGRGNPCSISGPMGLIGTIPAWAGKPRRMRWRWHLRQDHPRVGGET